MRSDHAPRSSTHCSCVMAWLSGTDFARLGDAGCFAGRRLWPWRTFRAASACAAVRTRSGLDIAVILKEHVSMRSPFLSDPCTNSSRAVGTPSGRTASPTRDRPRTAARSLALRPSADLAICADSDHRFLPCRRPVLLILAGVGVIELRGRRLRPWALAESRTDRRARSPPDRCRSVDARCRLDVAESDDQQLFGRKPLDDGHKARDAAAVLVPSLIEFRSMLQP